MFQCILYIIIYEKTTLNLYKKGVLKMLNIIPNVKIMEIKNGFMTKTAIYYNDLNCDERVLAALKMIPYNKLGAKLDICINEKDGEGYELYINENDIVINADGAAGAFYAIQTLRQIFTHKEIPCLYIKDEPDFKYRGFYHDVTRGKIPTVATIKSLIDKMAYYKLNSLQLYVEHTYQFKEYSDLKGKYGYFTSDEITEIGAYCKQNFIDFVPSLSTFGHLYELLNQDKYKHLRVLKECDNTNFWNARMAHHTIDPLNPESIMVIKSLIDQYAPNFESDYFNICCDETFDLREYEKQGEDIGKIYTNFVMQIIDYIKQKDKNVMMWADILLQHPETIDILPDNICFLNWDYGSSPNEEKIMKFEKMGKTQIVCPGTGTWSRLCENVENEEKNISLMAEYGYKHGALGVLNTNWGDWGNPCSLELAMYGLALGAEKSWSVKTEINDEFYNRINFILFKNDNGVQYLKELNRMHVLVSWNAFSSNYFEYRYNSYKTHKDCLFADLVEVQKAYKDLSDKLNSEKWVNDEYRQEMLISAEGICLIAELSQKILGKDNSRVTNTYEWLNKYKKKWLEKNKESELHRIEEMFTYCEKK